MKPIVAVIRCLVISPEMLVVCLVFAVFTFSRRFFGSIDGVMAELNPLTMLVPFGSLIAFSFIVTRSLLFPMKGTAALIRWPLYPEFRLRVFCGLILVFIGAAFGVFGAFASGKDVIPVGMAATSYVAGILCCAICVFTLFMAQLRARSALQGGR